LKRAGKFAGPFFLTQPSYKTSPLTNTDSGNLAIQTFNMNAIKVGTLTVQ
jgi:hypothetical protein